MQPLLVLQFGRFHGGIQGNDLRLPAPQPAQRFVDDDAHQPGGQPGVGAKAVQRAPGAQIGLLQRVLGFGVAVQDAAGGAKQQAVVAPHDGFERAVLAGGRARGQLGVRGQLGSRRLGLQ
ncbi:Uncharacterised protein [Bordetella pertussis]|nr:Uncharacterised protein [Bordetella pertussis]